MARVTRLTKPCPECGKSLHIDAGKCSCGWQDVRAALKASNAVRFSCSAFGCHLPGSLYESSQSKEGWCFIHDAHRESMDIQGLTRAINARRNLFDGAYAVLKEVSLVDWWGEVPAKYAKPFRDAGRVDLLPSVDERKKTIASWVSRVRRELESDILRDMGVDVRSAKAPVAPRIYAPNDDDIEAARIAELAIANGTWKKPTDVIDGAV